MAPSILLLCRKEISPNRLLVTAFAVFASHYTPDQVSSANPIQILNKIRSNNMRLSQFSGSHHKMICKFPKQN